MGIAVRAEIAFITSCTLAINWARGIINFMIKILLCGSLYIYYYIYKNSNISTRACEYVDNRNFLICPASIHMCIKCLQLRNIMHTINMSILNIFELFFNFLDIFF